MGVIEIRLRNQRLSWRSESTWDPTVSTFQNCAGFLTSSRAPNILERTLGPVSPAGTADQYQYTGTYHAIVHSHLDAVDCHMMVDGKGYNGRAMEEIAATGGCPKGNINALKDGVVTRAILFDATLLPGKATAQGWLEPGTAIHREDLEAVEKLEHVTRTSALPDS